MEAENTTTFEVTGPKPGAKVWFIKDGGVYCGHVDLLVAHMDAYKSGHTIEVEIVFVADRDTRIARRPVKEVFFTAQDAINDAFGEKS